MLKLGCTLSSLANICLDKFKCLDKSSKHMSRKFYQFCESDKELCEKIRKDMTRGTSKVSTPKAVVDETFIRNSSNVGIDASQLYPFSMCQDMPSVHYTRWEFDTGMQNLKQGITDLKILRICSCLSIRKQDQNAKLSFFTSGKQKKIDWFNVDGYCDHCKTVFEAMGCYYHFWSCQEARPSLTDQEIEQGNKKREMDEL